MGIMNNNNRNQNQGVSMDKSLKYLIAGAVGLFLFFVFSPFTVIPSGHRGVVTHFGKVQEEILDEGLHFRTPIFTSIHKVSVRVQKTESESDAASKDMQKVRAKLAINWHVNPTLVNKMYQAVGDEDDIVRQIIAPAVSEVLKAATAKLTAEEILTRRIELKHNIDEALMTRLKQYNVLVDDISLVDIDFTTDFNHAVEQKQIAEQDAKRAEYLTKKAQNEANAEIERARGQAEAQKRLLSTLTKEILQQKAIDKWNGQFPQVMGSGTLPFINMKFNTKQKENE